MLSRNYCFTHNNYIGTELEDALPCKYIVYGKEVGASGTPHLQGFVSFATLKSLKQVVKLLPGCHIEVAKSVAASLKYTQKDGDVTERGQRPVSKTDQGQLEKDRWSDAFKAAQDGREEDIPAEIRFKYDKNIERIKNRADRKRKLPDTDEQMLWYYGASGTGKSRKAREDNPGCYLKTCNKWWDGYENQDVVLIEDFGRNHDKVVDNLKIWADRYDFKAETKGSFLGDIRPRVIIVTSNYHPGEIWTEKGDLEPILRRFRCVKFGDTPFEPAMTINSPPARNDL